MKDYYHILELEPDATADEIHAAYRRLIKANHPDSLDPGRREDPDTLQQVRELNEAYGILGNKEKKIHYDETYRWHKLQAKSGAVFDEDAERLVYLIRCGKTRRTYMVHLARPRGSGAPFAALGFELLAEVPMLNHTVPHRRGIWRRIVDAFSSEQEGVGNAREFSGSGCRSMPENNLRALLNQSTSLTMGDIDWGFYACPECESIVENENGTLATWSACSRCGHIKCVGSFERTRWGTYSV